MSNNQISEKNKVIKMPHPLVILFSIIVIIGIASFFVPAGQYSRVEDPSTGRQVVDPDSFSYVENNPIGPFGILQAIPKGLTAASSIAFFILLVAGAFAIITATGTIEAAISRIAILLSGYDKLMIPVIMVVFSVGGATVGMSEENVIFVPIGIALARALGYDAIVGMSIVALGSATGFNSGVFNPFTIGVAQGIAELPVFSGIEYRFIIWGVMIVVTSLYVMKYGAKVKKDPTKSYVYDLEQIEKGSAMDINNIPKMSIRQKFVLLSTICGFSILVYGVSKLGWYITEISALFLGMGLVAGIIAGFAPNKIVQEFVGGAKDLMQGALMVGFARGILIVLTETMLIDTMIYTLASIVSFLPNSIAVLGMYFVQIIVNFFIPSGSGQAAVTMPIMIPLADVLNINRQVAVLAYQFGDGFTNSIIPTSGTLMALLSVAKIPYNAWVRYVAPLIGIWVVIGGIFIFIANMINYGPF